MRKIFFFVVALSALLFGCNSQKGSVTTKNETKIDYDFTNMNFNIATAQIFNMTLEPDKYKGKTVRFRGQFMSIEEEGFSHRFFSVLQYDATACCQTGFMFYLPKDKKYPEDYPEEMSEIEVCGVLTSDVEEGMDIVYLACDSYKLVE